MFRKRRWRIEFRHPNGINGYSTIVEAWTRRGAESEAAFRCHYGWSYEVKRVRHA